MTPIEIYTKIMSRRQEINILLDSIKEIFFDTHNQYSEYLRFDVKLVNDTLMTNIVSRRKFRDYDWDICYEDDSIVDYDLLHHLDCDMKESINIKKISNILEELNIGSSHVVNGFEWHKRGKNIEFLKVGDTLTLKIEYIESGTVATTKLSVIIGTDECFVDAGGSFEEMREVAVKWLDKLNLDICNLFGYELNYDVPSDNN